MFKLAITFAFLLGGFAAAQNAAPASHWQYDRSSPLDVQETGAEHRGNITIQEISYASPKGGRVPAYLVVPNGKGPFPAVLWGHWYWPNSEFSNRKEFLDEAVVLAKSGVISLLTTG